MQPQSLTIDEIINDVSKDLSNLLTSTDNGDDENGINVTTSSYLTETEFTNLTKQKKVSNNTHVTILALNIANLLSKLNSLKILIDNISSESNVPSIIALTETHLSKSRSQGYTQTDLQNLLQGYEFFHNDRTSKKGGGVGIFVSGKMENATVEPSDGFFQEEIFEGITLKIPNISFPSGKKDLIVLAVYRQPGNENIQDFLETMEKWLEKYNKKSNKIVITGDMNLDLLKYDSHTKTSDYLDLMVSQEMLPLITKPTRIKHSSATLIDHIFSNNQMATSSGILLSELAGSHGYTDHYPTFCIFETGKLNQESSKQITTKFFTHEGHTKRKDALKKEDWSELFNQTNANTAYEIFHHKYCKIYNSSITIKTKTIGSKRIPKKPWMTQEILKKMRKRDRLVKIKDRRSDYLELRNQIVTECRKAQRNYINKNIQENINNVKEHWKVLKNVMGKTNNKSTFPSKFKHGENWISDDQENAECMNNYFAQVGPETNQSVGPSRKSSNYYLKNFSPRNEHELEETTFTKEDVIQACESINKKKSCDAYGLSQAVVISDADLIAPMIAHIANCCLQEGTCPELTKVARVIPVYKEKGENFLYSNYRPISLIPVLSKILEKLIHNKLSDFLVRYQILFKSQYGFQKGRNTAQATLDFLKTVETALQENEYAIGIFCDLSKAFDTLDHETLLNKLEHYGIRGKWLSWLKSYLSNRKQYVDFNGKTSSHQPITVGVPQGSILGPLLFLIYINDLPASLQKLIAVLFADDTNLVIKGNNLNELSNQLNSDLENLNDFFRTNKLKLNASKTKVVCFRKKSANITETQLNIQLDGTKLKPEDNATFLGLTLDKNLTWEEHCKKVANKMAQNAGVLNRVKKSIPAVSMKILFNSIIFPHYSYCLEVWGNCQQKYLKRIIGLQKKTVRCITKSHWLAHTEPRMKNLKILKLEDQHQLQCLALTFNMLKGLAPDVFELIQKQNANSSHALRSSTNRPDNLRIRAFRAVKNTVSSGCLFSELWNSLPTDLQNSTSCKQLKNQLKTRFLNNYQEDSACTNPKCIDRRYHQR